MLLSKLCSFLIAILVEIGLNSALPTQEHILYSRLLKNYEPSVRPVLNHSSTLNINFRMKLTQVLELSEKDQTLSTSIWIEQQWYDEFLKWNSSAYSGIRSLRMPSNKVWLPDTYIYNSASTQESLQGAITGPYVMVNSNGLVKFPVPMKLKSNCEVDIAYFPFDQQICYIKFASWIHDLSAINFTTSNSIDIIDRNSVIPSNLERVSSSIDLTGYVDNSGWILRNVTLLRRERTQANGVHPELIYFIHIKRRNLYYIFNVIIPCAMLSVLTCMTFWLPCLSGEKVTMGLTCFVAYSVFMLMVAEKVPTTSETVPIISIYLTIVMSFTSISVIMAVIVTNIHEKSKICHSKQNRMPKFIRKLFIHHLARYLGMKRKARDLLKFMIKRNKEGSKSKTNDCSLTTTTTTNCDDNNKKLFEMIANDFMEKQKKCNITWDCDSHKDCCLTRSDNHLNIHSRNYDNEFYCPNHEDDRNEFICNQKYNFFSTDKTIYSPANIMYNNRKLLSKNKDILNLKNRTRGKKSTSNENEFHSGQRSESEIDMDPSANTKDHSEPNKSNKSKDQKSKNINKNKSYDRLRLTIKRENVSLYFAYEYALVGLVLDRLFFWIYFSFTLLSYIISLYVFPFLIQETKNDYTKNIP